jgi:hypothetical protein
MGDDQLVNTNIKHNEYNDESKKNKFNQYYHQLVDCKRDYAESVGADWVMCMGGPHYESFKEEYLTQYIEMSEYDKINFYKLYLMYELARNYDNVLFLDFDVVPAQSANFFMGVDLTEGIAMITNQPGELTPRKLHNKSVRSPLAKYHNTAALLLEEGIDHHNNVFNTGIVGANREWLDKLGYFDNFDEMLQLMESVRGGDTIYPEAYHHLFGYDNETLMSYLIQANEVSWQELDKRWHFFYDKQGQIPYNVVLVHLINKRFEELL